MPYSTQEDPHVTCELVSLEGPGGLLDLGRGEDGTIVSGHATYQDSHPYLPVQQPVLDVLPLECLGLFLDLARLTRAAALRRVFDALDRPGFLFWRQKLGRVREVVDEEEGYEGHCHRDGAFHDEDPSPATVSS